MWTGPGSGLFRHPGTPADTAMKLRIVYVGLAILWASVSCAESEVDGVPDPITKAFGECLVTQGRTGPYTSSDGGKSAIILMTLVCKTQWEAWHKQCVAEGGTDGGPNGCTMRAGRMAQLALKLVGK